MANKINPITGKLDTVRSDEEIEAIAAAVGGVQSKIEGTGGGIVTDTADFDSTGALNSAGQFQVQDTAGNGFMQLSSNQMVYGRRIQQLILETGTDYAVARNWLFNSKTSHREQISKVTMQASDPTKEISLFTGSNGGYNITIYFGTHVNHQAPFTIVCTGTGIVGHPSGISMDTPGQAVTLQQIGTSEYVVIGANFDLSGGGTTPPDESQFFTGDQILTSNTNMLNIGGLTVGKYYTIQGRIRVEPNSGTATDGQILHTNLPGVGGGSSLINQNIGGDLDFLLLSYRFLATGTSLTLSAFFTGTGDMRYRHELTLTEHNNTIETTKFTS